MKREQISFYIVEPGHLKLHARLINWARWCKPRFSGQVQPMFRQYRSGYHIVAEEAFEPIDTLDAANVQKAVSKLPEKQRAAINWNYVHPGNPRSEAQKLGVSMEGLQLLIRSARIMLINRKA